MRHVVRDVVRCGVMQCDVVRCDATSGVMW